MPHTWEVPRRRPEVILFGAHTAGEVVAAMVELAASRGWINLQPGYDPDDAPAESALFGLLAGRGAALPVCTWKPHEHTRDGTEYVALGVQHGAGSKVVALLADRGVEVPEGWVVVQDNPRHGLIVAARPHDRHDVVLDWLLRVGEQLSPIALTGEWRALVYRR